MGETILGNRYEIIKKIGDGGMAFVYKAKDILLNRIVAVKVLRPEFVDDDEFLGKFKREAEAVASLSHPNIVNVYDVGEDGKVHYIVMEYVDGQNLKEIIKNEGTLDEYTSLDITKQIAKALSAAHKNGIIHRDIKPHNILISNEGRVVKVADFGIAKAVSNSTMTNIGSIIGSVHYFSPEQAKGKFVTNNADLYSLGIVLYEMIIGKVPFRGDSPISIALQHINDEIEFTSEEQVNIPQSVRTIIKKLTEKSSVDRYQSAEEVIEDIEYIEKNIDLDFIKEYDNYVTKNIDMKELNKQIDIEKDIQDEDLDYDEEYDEYYDDEYEEEKPKFKKNKKNKKSPNKSRKRLKIALAILILILSTQVFIFAKFFLGGFGNNAGQITAPDLYNLTLDEAQKSLDKLNLNIRVDIEDEYSNEVEKGKIISQQPMSGYALQDGDTVTLVLSKGPMKGNIPNVVGLTLGEAGNLLKENKLSLGNIKYEYSDTYNNGIVISQDPKSGSENNQEWGSVNVVVSKGQKEEIKLPEKDDEEDDKKEEEQVKPPVTTTPKPDNSNNGNSSGNNGNGSGNHNGGNNGGNTNNQPQNPNSDQPEQGDSAQDTNPDPEPPQTEEPQSEEH